jgi:hypothetical protein
MKITCRCEWIGLEEYCDQPSVPDRSYCPTHLWRVYKEGSSLTRRRSDQRLANYIIETETESEEEL